jgi:hypothetical protein
MGRTIPLNPPHRPPASLSHEVRLPLTFIPRTALLSMTDLRVACRVPL